MTQETHNTVHDSRTIGHRLCRYAGYGVRSAIAAVGMVLVCLAFLVAALFGLYDYLTVRRRKHHRIVRPRAKRFLHKADCPVKPDPPASR